MQNEWLQTIGNMYWFFMLVAYPLTVRNGYFDIATSKLVFFLTFSLIFILANVVLRTMNKTKNGEPFGITTLPKAELIWLAALSVCIVITFIINGDYFYASWGPGETHTSILFLGLVLLSYLFLRLTPFDKKIFAICAVTGVTIVCLLAILQFVGLDPGKLFEAVTPYAPPTTFMSTMSNRDLVGFYMVVMFPFCFYLATVAKWRILGLVGVIITGCAILICDTDAALLCFGFEMVLLVFICIENEAFNKIFPLCLLLLGCGITVIGFYDQQNTTLSLSFIHKLCINPKVGILVMVGAVLVFVLLRFVPAKVFKYIALLMLIGLCLYPVYIFIYTRYRNDMLADTSLPYDSFLYFRDAWGSTRGRIWRISVNIFKESNFLTKLFGYGVHGYPQQYYTYCLNNNETAAIELAYYDAHNMYLHFLVEYGIFGLISACGLFIYRAKAMLTFVDEDCFYKIKAIALITAMVNAIFLFCNNINMAFIPSIL